MLFNIRTGTVMFYTIKQKGWKVENSQKTWKLNLGSMEASLSVSPTVVNTDKIDS